MAKVLITVFVLICVIVGGYFLSTYLNKNNNNEIDKNIKYTKCVQMCSSKTPMESCPMCQGQDLSGGTLTQDCIKCVQEYNNNLNNCMSNCKNSN